MTKYERGLGMLGLARRARALTSGFSQVEASLKAGEGKLLLLDGEISPETEKQLVPLAETVAVEPKGR